MVNVANGPGVTYPDSLLAKKINAFKKLNPRKTNRVNKIFFSCFHTVNLFLIVISSAKLKHTKTLSN